MCLFLVTVVSPTKSIDLRKYEIRIIYASSLEINYIQHNFPTMSEKGGYN